jgi:hypothetical protein
MHAMLKILTRRERERFVQQHFLRHILTSTPSIRFNEIFFKKATIFQISQGAERIGKVRGR